MKENARVLTSMLNKFRLFASLICALGTLAASPVARCQLANPGFEEIAIAGKSTVPGWLLFGRDIVGSIDDQVSHGGKKSFRIDGKNGGLTSGIAQKVDATPFRGHVVRLSAWVRTESVGSGSLSLSIQLAIGADGINKRGASSLKVVKGTADWQKLSAMAYIHQSQSELLVGAQLGAEGKVWFDDFALERYQPAQGVAMAATARLYLDDAIARITADALYTDIIAWDEVTAAARELAIDAQSTSDTYAAIKFVLNSLGDGHSYFMEPSSIEKLRAPDEKDVQVTSRLEGQLAYLLISGFLTMNNEREATFLDIAEKAIYKLDDSRPCGWIVDLRQNGGGSLSAMLRAIAPLLPDGPLGYYINERTGSKSEIALPIGNQIQSAEKNFASLQRRKIFEDVITPVAVLIGPRTASSGEILAIAFKSRTQTRLFGELTAGQSSANKRIQLADGASMALTAALISDGTGKIYRGRITPDEPIKRSTGMTDIPGTDPTLGAAKAWLESTKSCVQQAK